MFTSETDEGMKMLVYCCIIEVDRLGVRGSRKSCASRPWEEGKVLERITNVYNTVFTKSNGIY